MGVSDPGGASNLRDATMITAHVLALALLAPGAMKCPVEPGLEMPGYEARQPVILVDGALVPPADRALEAVDGADAVFRLRSRELGEPDQGLEVVGGADAVFRITIDCWNPATNAFGPDGLPVVRVLTTALVQETRAPLIDLVSAQEAFRSRHGSYASDLASLETFGFAPDVTLDFEASGSGWTASTPFARVAYRCSASDESARTVGDEGEPQLDCEAVDALELAALRERYHGGPAR